MASYPEESLMGRKWENPETDGAAGGAQSLRLQHPGERPARGRRARLPVPVCPCAVCLCILTHRHSPLAHVPLPRICALQTDSIVHLPTA